ncbi:MAG: accA [Burkholderiales bacterium]|nr:accA [Burkholderiales bacterium]
MKQHFLEFEKPIAELSNKIEELLQVQDKSNVDINEDICSLKDKVTELTREVYSRLTPAQIAQVARHINRPRTLDYINNLFTNFIELHGDRHFADDKSIIAGLAKFGNQSVVVIGHQKGEERNQSEAIGKNLYEMSHLKTPIIVTIIGEGGSGGALAIAVGDQVNMLEYAIYSVITPEGCASILWKDASMASTAAEILGITALKLKSLNLIDSIITEPLGGAHSKPDEIMIKMKKTLKDNLKKLKNIPQDELLSRRFQRLMNYGTYTEIKE